MRHITNELNRQAVAAWKSHVFLTFSSGLILRFAVVEDRIGHHTPGMAYNAKLTMPSSRQPVETNLKD
jgi:hypothetical protein